MPRRNSNMWDIARALVLANEGLESTFNEQLLPAAFVDSWMANVTAYVEFVHRIFPVGLRWRPADACA